MKTNCKAVEFKGFQKSIEIEGSQACIEGKEATENPYQKGTEQFRLWANGWYNTEGYYSEGV